MQCGSRATAGKHGRERQPARRSGRGGQLQHSHYTVVAQSSHRHSHSTVTVDGPVVRRARFFFGKGEEGGANNQRKKNTKKRVSRGVRCGVRECADVLTSPDRAELFRSCRPTCVPDDANQAQARRRESGIRSDHTHRSAPDTRTDRANARTHARAGCTHGHTHGRQVERTTRRVWGGIQS